MFQTLRPFLPLISTLVLLCLASAYGLNLQSVWPVPRLDAVEVWNSSEFVAALINASVGTILLRKDLVMPDDAWPLAVVHIGRNLTIDGQSHLLNFTRAKGKMMLDPGVHLAFNNADITASSIGSFYRVFVESPQTFIWQRDIRFLCHACPPLDKLLAMSSALPRPAGFPGQQYVVKRHVPVCFKDKCYSPYIWTYEFAVDMLPTSYATVALKDRYTILKHNLTWICDTVCTEECIMEKGYDTCRTEMMDAQSAGLSHGYDRATVEAAFKVAVTLLVLLVGAVCWCIMRAVGGQQDGFSVLPAHSLSTSSSPVSSSRNIISVQCQELKDTIKLKSLLGTGSFGSVYSGTWKGQPAAVKVIIHSACKTEKVAREAAIGLRLTHPNVVRTYHYVSLAVTSAQLQELLPGSVNYKTLLLSSPSSSSSSGGTQDTSQTYSTWIVQELCDMGTLADYLKVLRSRTSGSGGHLSLDVILGYAVDIAKGMQSLHDNNICHGDLKARNVLLSTDPINSRRHLVKVADFGVSQALDADRSHLTTTSLGTISHMPPELLACGKLTREGDLYSFGILLYEILTGEVLYRNLTPAQVIHRVMLGDRPTFPLYVPRDVADLAAQCCAQNASERPTFANVSSRLQDIADCSRRKSL